MSESRPTESLRGEARRRGVTLSAVRKGRGIAAGIDPRVALGHAGPGEVPLSRRERRVIDLGGPDSPIGPIRLRGGGKDAGRAHDLIRDLADLLSGDLAPASWDARWRGRTFGGQKLPSATVVLAAAQAGRIDADRWGS